MLTYKRAQFKSLSSSKTEILLIKMNYDITNPSSIAQLSTFNLYFFLYLHIYFYSQPISIVCVLEACDTNTFLLWLYWQ